jgi:hypothetical protein
MQEMVHPASPPIFNMFCNVCRAWITIVMWKDPVFQIKKDIAV